METVMVLPRGNITINVMNKNKRTSNTHNKKNLNNPSHNDITCHCNGNGNGACNITNKPNHTKRLRANVQVRGLIVMLRIIIRIMLVNVTLLMIVIATMILREIVLVLE